jgi:hypothetical protein
VTRNEVIFSFVACVLLAVSAALVIILSDRSEDGVVGVAALGGAVSGVLAGQMQVRVDRRRRDRVH